MTFAFAGDVHFESGIRTELDAHPRDVLRSIRPVLSRADLAVVNLETAVTNRGHQPRSSTCPGPPTAFAALRAGGVDVASMANNHGMDYGEEVSGRLDRRRTKGTSPFPSSASA